MTKRLFFYCAISIAILLIVFIAKSQTPSTTKRQNFSWETVIKEKGAKEAWKDFKKTQEGLTSSDQHQNAHIFGSILYGSTGIEGVKVCDESFNYGCYHSLVGKAISKEGTNIVFKIKDLCKKNCQHGIGHGLLGATEYDMKGLKQSLEICFNLNDKTLTGCPNGVFMEYNFRTLHNGEKEFRKINKKDLFYPCNKLASEFINVCLYAQPQWWMTALGPDIEKNYEEVGKLCIKLVGDDRKICALGAGAVAPQISKWKIENMLLYCKKLNSHELEVYCRTGAANLNTTRQYKQSLCNGLGGNDLKTCLKNYL